MAKRDNWNKTEDAAEVIQVIDVTPEEPPAKPKIPFEHWFNKKLKAGEVRFYQDDSILIYFKEQGLTALEDEDEYERAFKKF